MKKLICGMFFMATALLSAQETRQSNDRLTKEQRTELHIKKLTLDLDLNPTQQKQISNLVAEQTAKKEAMKAQRKADKAAGVKLTADQKFAMRKQMMDEQASVKAQYKKILTPMQYQKWEKRQEMRREKTKKQMHKRVKMNNVPQDK